MCVYVYLCVNRDAYPQKDFAKVSLEQYVETADIEGLSLEFTKLLYDNVSWLELVKTLEKPEVLLIGKKIGC